MIEPDKHRHGGGFAGFRAVGIALGSCLTWPDLLLSDRSKIRFLPGVSPPHFKPVPKLQIHIQIGIIEVA